MDAIDSVLDGDEPEVQAISKAMGVLAAEQYVGEYNNGCLHMSGFEQMLTEMHQRRDDVFYVPLASLSTRMDH